MSAPGTLVFRRGPVSARVGVRGLLLGAAVWPAAVAVALWATTVGEYPMPLATVLDTLAGNGTLLTYDVVVNHRLPRAITGVLVGAAFGIAGALFQRIARNPLVSPDVIGINAGASAGAIVMIIGFGASAAWVTGGALAGAGVAAVAVYTIAYRNGFSGYRLVLVGIGVAAILSAAATFLLGRADVNAAHQAAIWLVGSLSGRSWPDVVPVALGLCLLLPPVLGLTRRLQVLELGDDLARSLSPRIGRARAVLLACAVGLSAVATASAGPVGFVALVAPQIVRRVLAERSPGLLASAGTGALVVVAADLVARTAFLPRELPVGVLTALVGAPVLIALLVRSNRIGASG
ncbi:MULTISPECIES: iron chelate uptake ABC transporter family permease subunit [unclassified Pseudonocardia]|uniref:FecCD family ABC transporter permease n=1 Tax=unclassified Pseudonocardia TaxID=2619320 RepID=UPI0001FFEB47|nr:iron chelate uptake ABC transporter family permease subunit [Pseudonocardia sp. Ae707_Ps1]OLM21000.1 ABC-type Fe3+-siderophore transport system, permease 2 component [Pseudonocardia sp. Ae707_Ps1]